MEGFFEEMTRLLQEKSSKSDNSLGCRLWKGCTDHSGYGKQRVMFPDESKIQIGTHRLAFMVSKGLTPSNIPKFGGPNDSKLEVSHLCNEKLCIEVTHLVLEPHEINKERQHCFKQHICTKSHEPNCLISNQQERSVKFTVY